MSKHLNKHAKQAATDMSNEEKQAIIAALSSSSGAYNEEARRVLGNPLGFVEGRPLSQPEIIASIMMTDHQSS